MDVTSPLANVDVSKLSDRDKQELQQFVMNESQKARIQSCTLGTCTFFALSFLLERIEKAGREPMLIGSSNPQPNRHLLQEVHS